MDKDYIIFIKPKNNDTNMFNYMICHGDLLNIAIILKTIAPT